VRSNLSIFCIYVLVLLLAGTFPIGAGDAKHGGALLHPAIPHVHGPGEDGATSQPQAPSAELKVSLTPTIETTAGGATEIPVTALTPPLPRVAANRPFGREQRLVVPDLPRPRARSDPPPDPPPTSLALA
jgi:hypothetical protein